MAMDDDQKACGGITLGGLLTLAVSVAMIVIGCMHLNFDSQDPIADGQCKAEPNIPVFLFVGGALYLGLLIIRVILQCCCAKCGETDSKFCSTLNFACKFSCILVFDVLAAIVCIGWLIVGTIWTMGIHDTVNTDTTLSPNYCPHLVYYFSFWLIVALWILTALALTCGLLAKFCNCFWGLICCKPCKKADQRGMA